MSLRRSVTGLLVLAVLAAPAAAAVVTTPAAAAEATDRALVTTPRDHVYLSPDGDGRHDVARVDFRLAARARVTLTISNEGATAFPDSIHLGQLEAGRHSWTFDGRDAEGHVVPDNDYRIGIVAQRGARRSSAPVTALVRTAPDRGHLVLSRPVVYPEATAVHDRVLVEYVREGWRDDGAAYYPDYPSVMPLRVRVSVLDRSGDAVFRARARDAYTPVVSWDGTKDGVPLPVGRYGVRVTVEDPVGHRTAYSAQVRVSHRQLAPVTTATTIAADEATVWEPQSPPWCVGCGSACSPVASARFEGGLAFPACFGEQHVTFAYFTMALPFAAAPADSYRVAATGGPGAPGSGGVGLLDETPVGPGDATAWTPVVRVALADAPYLPSQATAVRWLFRTEYTSYDVATFTVEYRHWVPVP